MWAGRASRIVGRVPHLRRALLACAVLAAATLAACGAESRGGLASGTLRTYVPSEMKGFDPTQAGEETTTTMVVNFYDQLYEFDYLQRPFALTPCLAAAMPIVSDDGLTYTIPLRRGIRFADDPCFAASRGVGREMTASDVEFCFLRLMDAHARPKGSWIFAGQIEGIDAFAKASETAKKDPRRADYRPEDGYPPVRGLEVVDDYTLRVRLVKRYPQFVWVLAMGYASVYPPEAIAFYGEEFMNHPVSTGPYRLAEYNPTQRAVFVRNVNYREDLYPSAGSPGDEAKPWRLGDAGRRLPLNERVVVTVHVETQPMWLKFLGGELDRAGVPKDSFDAAIDPSTRELRPDMSARGIRLEKDEKLEVIYDCFNMQDPVVGQGDQARAIRRAISLAIDLEWARKHLYNERVADVQGILCAEFPEFDPAFVNPWKRRPGESRAEVLARARQLLADAGVDVKRLPAIKQDVQESTTDRQFFLAVQRDLAEIGIRIEPHTVTWQEMQERIDRGEAQTWGISWGADYPDAQNFLQLFYGPNKPPGPNSANYQNPAFDRMYEEAAVLEPGPERTALYRKMQQMVVDDCVWVFKYRRTQYTLTHPWLSGYRYNDLSPRTFKYCRVDASALGGGATGARKPNLVPVAVVAVAALALLGAMVTVAFTTKRGW